MKYASQPTAHESARGHVTGEALCMEDLHALALLTATDVSGDHRVAAAFSRNVEVAA